MSENRLRMKVMENPDLYPSAARELRRHPFLDFARLVELVTQDQRRWQQPAKKKEPAPLSDLIPSKAKKLKRGPDSPILRLVSKTCKEQRERGGVGATKRALLMIWEWQRMINAKESKAEKELLGQDLQTFVCSLTEKPEKKLS